MAAAAAAAMSRCTYHAFLSFRGEDTRTNFTSHLYRALVQAGIHTFLDDDGIERGENIMAELQKAIKESKISIIVFSKDYASSRWCLDELVMIMEMRRTVGHTVMPVFYDVDPSQVRKQTGSFVEAFARHEMRFKDEMDKVERWRAALREVADLGGLVLGNRLESQFVKNIVEEIGNKLNRTILNLGHYSIGLDSRVKDINLWLQDASTDVGIAMIYGIGGIGKTTIAKLVYNLNFDRFQVRSFLGNVRETTKQPNGLVRLQRKLLSDILKEKTRKIYNADEGIIKIKDAICCKRVLLVLDDVDQLDQLNAIIGMQEWFYPGSKIIITTRHERLLRSHEVFKKFKVKQMDDDESLQLFSWHAFGQGYPIEGYMECSRSVVRHCGGLPLALQVLGSSLSGKSIDTWESALQKLKAIPDWNIQKILKISYDSLQDDHDKNLFLDIACFFIGVDKDYTVAILDGCDFYTTIGIQNLIDRCLLDVNGENKLMMHKLLMDMGREIIRQESTDDPGKRSRLWHHEDAYTVLKEKTGTKAVKGLTLDLHRLMEDKHAKTIGNCSKQRRLGFFSWQPINTSNEVDLETKTFMMMHKLKLLQLKYVNLRGDYRSFPRNLIWLCWHGCPLKSIPEDFCLEKLVVLDMSYSSLKYVWKGTRFLADLKFLNLSHCHGLVRISDFAGFPRLEGLILKDCVNLVEVDESIGELDHLVLLNLKDCKSLRKLPREIGTLKSLQELILSGCSKLDELPEGLREMESLRILHANGTAINQVYVTTSDTKKLSFLSITSRHSILWSWLSPTKNPLPISFSLAFLPHSIVSLSLANCNLSDEAISFGLSSLCSLEFLDLSGNPFHRLPESINDLTMLKGLRLCFCRGLQSLPKYTIRSLWLSFTHSKSSLNAPFMGWMLEGCEKLFEFNGLFRLEPIKKNNMGIIKSLGLYNLDSLGSIEVDLYNYLTCERWKTPLQVLHECGVVSIFLPGTEVPDCFSLKSMGASISFDVPRLVGHKMHGLNLCTLYASPSKPQSSYFNYPHYAKISNKTKRKRWTYSPICYAIPGAKEKDMLWLSHWMFGDQLEGGDQIDVSVVLLPYFQVKMCGICLVYEPEVKVTQSNTEEPVLSTFGWYQTLTLTQAGTDAYFCCHHSLATLERKIYRDTKLHQYDYLRELNPQLKQETCIICEDD